MKIPKQFRVPVIISVALHLALLIFLMIELPSRHTYRMDVAAPAPIVQAVAVNQRDVNSEMMKLKEQERQKQLAEQKQEAQEQARLKKIQQEALALKQQRLAEQQRVAELKQQQIQLKQAQQLAEQKQREVEKQKAATEKLNAEKQKALALKQEQQKHAQELAQKQQALQQKLLQQQLAAEQQELAQVRETQMQGVLDQYKAAIIKAIQDRWIVPDGVDKSLSCVLSIRLGPGGVVLSVDTLKSSGDAILDRSAKVAVFKASPLPVPADATIFEKFRDLRLTVRPLEVTNQ